MAWSNSCEAAPSKPSRPGREPGPSPRPPRQQPMPSRPSPPHPGRRGSITKPCPGWPIKPRNACCIRFVSSGPRPAPLPISPRMPPTNATPSARRASPGPQGAAVSPICWRSTPPWPGSASTRAGWPAPWPGGPVGRNGGCGAGPTGYCACPKRCAGRRNPSAPMPPASGWSPTAWTWTPSPRTGPKGRYAACSASAWRRR